MLEIQLMHGTIWINPYHVTSIEPASLTDRISGSFIMMQNGNGWNTPLPPGELAAKVISAKIDTYKAN